jgi:hypothetical protein
MPPLSTDTLAYYLAFAYVVRFWGWDENEREQRKDHDELSARARAGIPLYGQSEQPEWVQAAAYRNSAFSQLKFGVFSFFLSRMSQADI